MVTALFVAVVVLALVGTVNLALILRLSHLVRSGPPAAAPAPATELVKGAHLPSFAAVSASGAPVDAGQFSDGLALVGFFAPGCRPCHDSLPGFVALAADVNAHDGQVLTVIAPHPQLGTSEVQELLGVAHDPVLAEDRGTGILSDFHIAGYPTFMLFDRGTLLVNSPALGDVRLPVQQ